MRDFYVAAGVLAFVFLTHAVCPNATSSDSHLIVLQMNSALTERNFDLDEYPAELARHQYTALECVDGSGHSWRAPFGQSCGNGHSYGWYPIGGALVALPVFTGLDLALRVVGPMVSPHVTGASKVVRGFFARDYVASYSLAEMVIASFLMGISAALMYLIARRWLGTAGALAIAFLFAYGTAAWSTGSRALWQHTTDILVITLAIFLVTRGHVIWSALPVAMAYFIRPTSVLVVGAFGLYVLLHHRREFLRWAALAAAVGLSFMIYYLHLYGTPLPSYFMLGRTMLRLDPGPVAVAMAGHCLSASRGLFVFSPFLLFSLVGIVVAVRKRWAAPFSWYLAALLVAHWFLISCFTDWSAGHCFGPRYFSDMTPVLVLFLIPLLVPGGLLRRSRAAVVVFTVLAAVSVWIHYRGATVWAVEQWNLGGHIAERAWDWHDPQFLRGL